MLYCIKSCFHNPWNVRISILISYKLIGKEYRQAKKPQRKQLIVN